MRIAPLLVALLAVVLPANEVQAQVPDPAPVQTAFPVKPGDRIQLKIWREPDMSASYLVSAGGTVTLPLLGVVNVVDSTPKELEDQLVSRYSSYLRTPTIDVIIQRRIEIGGAVKAPSLYWVDPTVTVFGALALAGGPADRGQPEEVELRRDGLVLTTFLNYSTSLSESPMRSGDQLWVPERGWWYRNSTYVVTGVSLTVSVLIAVWVSN